jgi:hypothetical protein
MRVIETEFRDGIEVFYCDTETRTDIRWNDSGELVDGVRIEYPGKDLKPDYIFEGELYDGDENPDELILQMVREWKLKGLE